MVLNIDSLNVDKTMLPIIAHYDDYNILTMVSILTMVTY